MKTQSPDVLLADFTNAAISYSEAAALADSRKANKANSKAMNACEALKVQGARDRILDLLDFGHPAVRLMAASFAMRSAPERGEPVLQEIANGPPGEMRASAWFTLDTRRNHPEMLPTD